MNGRTDGQMRIRTGSVCMCVCVLATLRMNMLIGVYQPLLFDRQARSMMDHEARPRANARTFSLPFRSSRLLFRCTLFPSSLRENERDTRRDTPRRALLPPIVEFHLIDRSILERARQPLPR